MSNIQVVQFTLLAFPAVLVLGTILFAKAALFIQPVF